MWDDYLKQESISSLLDQVSLSGSSSKTMTHQNAASHHSYGTFLDVSPQLNESLWSELLHKHLTLGLSLASFRYHMYERLVSGGSKVKPLRRLDGDKFIYMRLLKRSSDCLTSYVRKVGQITDNRCQKHSQKLHLWKLTVILSSSFRWLIQVSEVFLNSCPGSSPGILIITSLTYIHR